jgi:hypothetical protein
MSDLLLTMLAEAQDDERDCIRRGDDGRLRAVRQRITSLETLLARRS